MRTIIFATCALLLYSPMLWQQESTKPELADDDYAIYSVVINNSYAEEGIERIVVGDHTSMGLPPVMMGMTQPGDSPGLKKIREAKETTSDFDNKGKMTPAALEKKFLAKVPVVLISEAERDRIFVITKNGAKPVPNMKGFEEFHRLYPKSQGFMSVSRIGFNPDRTRALVYVGNLCGGLCGTGQYYLLTKDGHDWKIDVQALVWIS